MAQLFRRSPREYFLRHVARRLPPKPPTAGMRFGSLAHLATWEPYRIHEATAMPPAAWNLHKPADRAARDAWLASLPPHVIPTTDAELGKAMAIATSLLADPFLASIFDRDRQCESAMHWECSYTGLPRKAMFDMITQDRGPVLIPDLKTISEDYPDGFRSPAIRYGYALQAAWYLEAAAELDMPDARYLPIVVRTEEPFDHLVWEFDADTLAAAHSKNYETMRRLADAVESGLWEHPMAGRVNTLSLPLWSFS